MTTRTFFIAAAVLLQAVAAARAADAPAPVAPNPARAAVACLPFEDKSLPGSEVPPLPGVAFKVEDPMPWLGDGIPAAVEFTLERGAAVNVVPRADLGLELKQKKGVDLTATAPPEEVREMARREGVTHLVSGSFVKTEKDLSFTVKVSTVAGEELAAKDFAGKITDLFALTTQATAFVIASAGAGDAANIIPREPTADLEAYMWFARGASRVYTGERISFYLTASEKDPYFAEAFLKLGDAYRMEKNYEEAKTAYEKAREAADYYPSAPTGLAAVARKLDAANVDGAVALLNEALAIDPNYVPAYDNLGSTYFAAQKYDLARAAYEKVVAIWPTNKDGYYALGNTLWLVGKDSPQWKTILQQAIDAYNRALEIDPDFAACHYNVASVYKIFENVDRAIYHYRRYIELEPNSPKKTEIEATIADWEAKFGPK